MEEFSSCLILFTTADSICFDFDFEGDFLFCEIYRASVDRGIGVSGAGVGYEYWGVVESKSICGNGVRDSLGGLVVPAEEAICFGAILKLLPDSQLKLSDYSMGNYNCVMLSICNNCLTSCKDCCNLCETSEALWLRLSKPRLDTYRSVAVGKSDAEDRRPIFGIGIISEHEISSLFLV
jgi:hypothetical protein